MNIRQRRQFSLFLFIYFLNQSINIDRFNNSKVITVWTLCVFCQSAVNSHTIHTQIYFIYVYYREEPKSEILSDLSQTI